ncbi:glycosyl hydrolase family 18 protein [Psychromonas sp. psych-6C06]|uniref:glycosyl hydrolase family 18 protein n=1 Tax=Psychromonas sp. psych-6C06 TaxID=2058089 RepID=UPI00187C68FA|nr:glycosyl hydrolase family 18 protein [Psychromonas sp. psych-6C06]
MSLFYKSISLLIIVGLFGCDDNRFTEVIDDNWIKEPEVCEEDSTAVSFKKVAYWTPDETDNIELIRFNALTHVNYTHIAFNADGTLVTPEDIEPLEDLVALAQADGAKVGISLGAWAEPDDSTFNAIAMDNALINTFIDNISDFLEEYELDGVDLNWQSIDSDEESDKFKALLEKLSEELTEQGKYLTITSPSGEDDKQANNLSKELFAYVDFVNVMAFDSTNNDSLHSSLQDAQDAITYWTDRCLIKNKLVLGIPLYSAGNAVRSYDYLIRDDISYACLDESERRNYNGIPTVIEKTNYSLLNAGGVMLKSLEQDVYARNNDDVDYSEYSIVNVINETVLGNTVSVCQ